MSKTAKQTNTEVEESLKTSYQRMSLLKHIKSLPDTYIGSVESEETEQYVVNRDVEPRIGWFNASN